jgi:hypothetical protein
MSLGCTPSAIGWAAEMAIDSRSAEISGDPNHEILGRALRSRLNCLNKKDIPETSTGEDVGGCRGSTGVSKRACYSGVEV